MPKYRKVRGSSHTRIEKGKRVVYFLGDVMECNPHEIRNFMDQWEPLDVQEHEKAMSPQFDSPEVTLKVVPRGNSNAWFDVINPATGRPLNDKALRKDEAEALVGATDDAPEDILKTLDWNALVDHIEEKDLEIDPDDYEDEAELREAIQELSK